MVKIHIITVFWMGITIFLRKCRRRQTKLKAGLASICASFSDSPSLQMVQVNSLLRIEYATTFWNTFYFTICMCLFRTMKGKQKKPDRKNKLMLNTVRR